MYEKNHLYLGCHDTCVDEEGNIWFFAQEMNVLCCIDVNTKELECVCSIAEYGKLEKRLFESIEYINGYIILIPYRARHIAVFDCHTRDYKIYKVLEPRKKRKPFKDGEFIAYGIVGDYLYMAGFCFPGIIRFDPKSGEQILHDRWIEDIKPSCKEELRFYFGGRLVVEDNTLVIPCGFSHTVFTFDTNNEVGEFHAISDGPNSLWDISYNGQYYCSMSGFDDKVYKWNRAKNTTSYLKLRDYYEKDEGSIGSTFYWKEYLFILPKYNSPLLIYDFNNDKIFKITPDEYGLKYNPYKRIYSPIAHMFAYKDKLVMIDASEGTISYIDIVDGRLVVSPFYVKNSYDNICKFIKQLEVEESGSERIYSESSHLDLCMFIHQNRTLI